MAVFIRLDPDRPHLNGTVRLLRPEDYRVAVSAAEMLADASARAQATLKGADEAYEAERQRGYDEGMAQARAEIAEQMMEIVGRSVDYLASAEEDVAETVLICLRKILGEFSEEELVLRAARNALDVVRNETRVTLRVRPEVQSALHDRIGEILGSQGGVGFLEVVADSGLPKGGCRLETEVGVVDASIDQQVAALEKVIRSRAGSRQSSET